MEDNGNGTARTPPICRILITQLGCRGGNCCFLFEAGRTPASRSHVKVATESGWECTRVLVVMFLAVMNTFQRMLKDYL